MNVVNAKIAEYQGCIKRTGLPNDEGPILCLIRIVLVVVLALVIGILLRLFDYD